MNGDREIPQDAGRAPPFDRDPREADAAAGDGGGYSGQEYHAEGQRKWRKDQKGNDVAPDGEARGSGVSAGGGNHREEYGSDIATGGGDRPPEGN